MNRLLIVSVVLLGAITYFIMRWERAYNAAQPPRQTRIDIYADRITYRTGVYATPSTLAIGLKAAQEPPEVIEVHGCAALESLPGVLDVVRGEGLHEFAIVLPEGC